MLGEPGVAGTEGIAMRILHEADGFHPAADDDAHAVIDDLLGGGGDRHHARRALPVEAHPCNRDW